MSCKQWLRSTTVHALGATGRITIAAMSSLAVDCRVHLETGDPISCAFWEPHLSCTCSVSEHRDWYQSRHLKTVTGDSLGFGPPGWVTVTMHENRNGY